MTILCNLTTINCKTIKSQVSTWPDFWLSCQALILYQQCGIAGDIHGKHVKIKRLYVGDFMGYR
jgi:hypothetical protein